MRGECKGVIDADTMYTDTSLDSYYATLSLLPALSALHYKCKWFVTSATSMCMSSFYLARK